MKSFWHGICNLINEVKKNVIHSIIIYICIYAKPFKVKGGYTK